MFHSPEDDLVLAKIKIMTEIGSTFSFFSINKLVTKNNEQYSTINNKFGHLFWLISCTLKFHLGITNTFHTKIIKRINSFVSQNKTIYYWRVLKKYFILSS